MHCCEVMRAHFASALIADDAGDAAGAVGAAVGPPCPSPSAVRAARLLRQHLPGTRKMFNHMSTASFHLRHSNKSPITHSIS